MGLIGKGNLLVEGDAQINGSLSVGSGGIAVDSNQWVNFNINCPGMSNNSCRFYYNDFLKLCVCIFTFSVRTSADLASGDVIGQGFPKPFHNAMTAVNDPWGGTGKNVYINPSGYLMTDVPLPKGIWFTGCLVYPYSSL